MFCLYCGSKLPTEALFCNVCGKRQGAQASTSSEGNAISTNAPSSSAPLSYEEPPSGYSSGLSTPLQASIPISERSDYLSYAPPIPSKVTSPAPSTPTFISKQKAGYVVAGLGGILALIAFFFMPYFAYGIFSFTGQQLASFGSQASGSPFGNQLSGLQLLWFEPIIAGIIILIAGWGIFKSDTSHASGSEQAIAGLIILSVLMLIVLIGRYIYDLQPIISFAGYSSPGLASFYSSGFWIYLISMIGVGVGGIIQARTH